MYENKIVPLQMDRRKYLQSCVENMSITFVLFGTINIFFNLLINLINIGRINYEHFFKLFSITSGLWIVIILVQITSYLFSSGFFENLATIFLHDNERNKGDIWNIKSIGMFLTNIITLGWLSIFSFYGIFSYIINSFDLINNFMLSTTILNFSVNLLFVLNQFLYFLFKVHEIRNIEFHNCLIHFLPGFSRMLESIVLTVKSKIMDNLSKNKNFVKAKNKKRFIDHNSYPYENLFLIN
ncbi:hypothetical protein PFBG_04928 [Plasmodium falciparum 7G8]|uniref:Uncharacterized protein n=1 Tax=Plasmodium falciparum (isolate 7G8) TaxID=57266 RepID=W7F6E1_PLAF8|nr:hypothetical protein PFBG_04928 [Plasmodium falciparum 7G8]